MIKINVALCREAIGLSNYKPSDTLTEEPVKSIIMIGASVCGANDDASENPFARRGLYERGDDNPFKIPDVYVQDNSDPFQPASVNVHGHDDRYLRDAFKALAVQGVPIDLDVTIEVCNLTYGDDFLKEIPKADLQILCFVGYDEEEYDSRDYGSLRQSPLVKETTWADALTKSDQRYVYNVTDEETTIRNNQLKQYFNCISPDKLEFYHDNDRDNGLKSGTKGFLFEPR